MKRIAVRVRVLAVTMIAAALMSTTVSASSAAPVTGTGHVPAVITFVGGLNVTFGSTEIATAFTRRDAPYGVVNLARPGASIRSPDCKWVAWIAASSCSTYDFWRTRLAEANAKIASDAYVVDLGINDTAFAGTATSPGYVRYPAKIDWLMKLFGAKPVFWTNLPCAIEPPTRAVGCEVVNASLARAAGRWPNLTVIDWATIANSHRDYISALFGAQLYSGAGATAWANATVGAIDAGLSAATSRTRAAGMSATTASVSTKSSTHPLLATVALVGDSNITFGMTFTAIALTQRDSPYAVVDLARGATTIRSPDCPMASSSCSTYDFWRTRLAEANAKIASDAYVVDLGINDTAFAGTATSPGYVRYPAKIDWLMKLFGAKPVFWTNLPCAIEPPTRAVGCEVVNASLARAAGRWPNLTVIDWATIANSRPDYMTPGDVHYRPAGNLAWASTVAGAIDPTFGQTTPAFLTR